MDDYDDFCKWTQDVPNEKSSLFIKLGVWFVVVGGFFVLFVSSV